MAKKNFFRKKTDTRKEYSFDQKMDYHVSRLGNNSKTEYQQAYSSGWISGISMSDDQLSKEAKRLEKKYESESAYYDNVSKEYQDAKNALKEANKLKRKTFSEMMGLRSGVKACQKNNKK